MVVLVFGGLLFSFSTILFIFFSIFFMFLVLVVNVGGGFLVLSLWLWCGADVWFLNLIAVRDQRWQLLSGGARVVIFWVVGKRIIMFLILYFSIFLALVINVFTSVLLL